MRGVVKEATRRRTADDRPLRRARADGRPDGRARPRAYRGDAGFRTGGWALALQDGQAGGKWGLGMSHWLPKNGAPISTGDRIMQALVRLLAFLPVYIAVVVTLTLVVVVLWRNS